MKWPWNKDKDKVSQEVQETVKAAHEHAEMADLIVAGARARNEKARKIAERLGDNLNSNGFAEMIDDVYLSARKNGN